MTRRTVALVSLVAFFALPVFAQDEHPSPRFAGDGIPAPPQQEEPWSPPDTSLPKALVSATETLFRAGLADPRGCEYREIEVATGSVWVGDAGVVHVHGWVLPAAKGAKAAFAVTWNGHVYPIVSTGAPASLSDDVNAMIEADAKEHADEEHFYRFRHAWTEQASLDHATCLPLKACLLLRAGEEDLARKAWETWVAGMRPDTNDDAIHIEDPFLMLARDWLWAIFDRAVCAHMRGDDRLALLSLRALKPMRHAVEEAAAERGSEEAYFDFLDSAEALLADQEARAVRREHPPAEAPKDRVATLILGLSEIAVAQQGQPGSVNLAEAADVEALVTEGEGAVDALIDAIERDARLTRSVQFGRDFLHGREVLPVAVAAYQALTLILGTASFPDVPEAEDKPPRVAFALRVRAYWKRNKDLSLPERWFAMLKDDTAKPPQWLQAAERIVEPSNVTVVSGSRFGSHNITTRPLRPGETATLKGEPLRDRRDPSVADLMARRVEAIATWDVDGEQRPYVVRDATAMAICLSEWDPRAHPDVLHAQMVRCLESLPGMDFETRWRLQDMPSDAVALAITLHRSGDKEALAAFLARLVALDPAAAGPAPLALLWTLPDEPAVRDAAAKLFSDDASPWRKWESFHEIIDARLLCLAEFRKLVVYWLRSTEPSDTDEPDGPRRCDIVAEALGGGDDAGIEFDSEWPVAKRDEAIRAWIARLAPPAESPRPR
jgi:hypothetical protein